MSRGYAVRCRERRECVLRRVEYLTARIEAAGARDLSFDKQERSALLWMLEDIANLDIVASVMQSDFPDAEKLATIASLIRGRLRPTAADLERTQGLVKALAKQRERV